MVDVVTFAGNFGSAIDTGEITDGAVTVGKLATALQGWQWNLLQNVTLTGSSVTSNTFSAQTAYLIIILNAQSNTANVELRARVNGDSSTNYDRKYIQSTTISLESAASEWRWGSLNSGATTYSNSGIIILSGATKAVASGRASWVGMAGDVREQCISGSWIGGNAVNITSFTFFPTSGTFTGTILIFGR